MHNCIFFTERCQPFTDHCQLLTEDSQCNVLLIAEFPKVTVSRSCDRAKIFWLCAKSWDLLAQTKNLCILTSFFYSFFPSYLPHIKWFFAQDVKTKVLTAQKKSTFRISYFVQKVFLVFNSLFRFNWRTKTIEKTSYLSHLSPVKERKNFVIEHLSPSPSLKAKHQTYIWKQCDQESIVPGRYFLIGFKGFWKSSVLTVGTVNLKSMSWN